MTEQVPETMLTTEQLAPWNVVADVYAAYLDRDQSRLVSAFADECTLWDSANRALRYGRDMKATSTDTKEWRLPLALETANPMVEVWGDTALVLHDLAATFEDASLNEELRVTAVLRLAENGWLIVHHHEELLHLS